MADWRLIVADCPSNFVPYCRNRVNKGQFAIPKIQDGGRLSF